jgi:hypothetical protein
VQRLAAYGEPVEGTPFGCYRLIALLGRGGMGEGWRANDTATNNRTVAIKTAAAADLAADHSRSVARICQESSKTSAANFAMAGHNDR